MIYAIELLTSWSQSSVSAGEQKGYINGAVLARSNPFDPVITPFGGAPVSECTTCRACCRRKQRARLLLTCEGLQGCQAWLRQRKFDGETDVRKLDIASIMELSTVRSLSTQMRARDLLWGRSSTSLQRSHSWMWSASIRRPGCSWRRVQKLTGIRRFWRYGPRRMALNSWRLMPWMGSGSSGSSTFSQ